MKKLAEIIDQQQRQRASHDELAERLFAALIEVAEEVCVQRDRLTTCRTLATAGQLFDDRAIDQYQPTDAELAERLQLHSAYFESVFEKVRGVSEST